MSTLIMAGVITLALLVVPRRKPKRMVDPKFFKEELIDCQPPKGQLMMTMAVKRVC